MRVEQLKYIIWAKDFERAIGFYEKVFGGKVVRKSGVMADLEVAGSIIGIHSGGEGKRTWTGMSFLIDDLFAGCAALKEAGGSVLREPVDTPEEPAHLAMCADSEGNEIMLTVPRRTVG